MPYENQESPWLNNTDFVNDQYVRRRLRSLDVVNQAPFESMDDPPLRDPFGTRSIAEEYPPSDRVIAIDGSRAEVPVGPDRYQAYVGFVEASVVSVDTELLRNQRKRQFVDDTVNSKSVDEQSVRMVMPSRNIIFGEYTFLEAWRKFTFENISEKEVYGTSLLSVYQDILERSGIIEEGKIRYASCPVCGTRKTQRRSKSEPEPCEFCSQTIYPTDRLRIQERVGKNQSNETALNVLMQVTEQLCTAITLKEVLNRGTEATEEVVIMKDGPLAQFDTAAGPIARGMARWLISIHEDENLADPHLVGLHKDGDFSVFANEIRSKMPSTRIVPMSSGFIYDNVVIQRKEDEEFGESPKTYYGKNFIYKTKGEYVFPLTVPRRYNEEGELLAEPEEYPNIQKVLSTLEDTALSLYQDSVIPIHMAHEHATIPEGVGEKVLQELSNREMLDAADVTR